MLLIKIFEYIVLILIVIFATIFALAGIGMTVTKDAINNMMKFKGDKKNE